MNKMEDKSLIIFDNEKSYTSNPFHMCKDKRLTIPSQLSKKWPLLLFFKNRSKIHSNSRNGSSSDDAKRLISDLENEVDSILMHLQNSEEKRSSDILLKNQIEATKMWMNSNIIRLKNRTKNFDENIFPDRQEKLVIPKCTHPIYMTAKPCLPQMDQVVTQISDNLKSQNEKAYFDDNVPSSKFDDKTGDNAHDNNNRSSVKRHFNDISKDVEENDAVTPVSHLHVEANTAVSSTKSTNTEYEQIKKFATAKRKVAITVKMLSSKRYNQQRSQNKRISSYSAKCKIQSILNLEELNKLFGVAYEHLSAGNANIDVTVEALSNCDNNSEFEYDDNTIQGGINRKGNNISQKCPSNSQSVHTMFLPIVLPLPRSITYVSTVYNIRSDDNPILRYVPYFGDDDTTGVDMSAYDMVPGQLEPEVCSEAEELVIMYIINKYSNTVQLQHQNESNVSSLLSLEQSDTPQANYSDSTTTPKLYPEVMSALENVLNLSSSQILKAYERATEGVKLRKILTASSNHVPSIYEKEFEKERLEELGNFALIDLDKSYPVLTNEDLRGHGGLGLCQTDCYEKLVENYRQLFCRRCFTYDCKNHFISQPMPLKAVDANLPFSCPVPGLRLPTDPPITSRADKAINKNKKNNNEAMVSNSIDNGKSYYNSSASICTDTPLISLKLDHVNNISNSHVSDENVLNLNFTNGVKRVNGFTATNVHNAEGLMSETTTVDHTSISTTSKYNNTFFEKFLTPFYSSITKKVNSSQIIANSLTVPEYKATATNDVATIPDCILMQSSTLVTNHNSTDNSKFHNHDIYIEDKSNNGLISSNRLSISNGNNHSNDMAARTLGTVQNVNTTNSSSFNENQYKLYNHLLIDPIATSSSSSSSSSINCPKIDTSNTSTKKTKKSQRNFTEVEKAIIDKLLNIYSIDNENISDSEDNMMIIASLLGTRTPEEVLEYAISSERSINKTTDLQVGNETSSNLSSSHEHILCNPCSSSSNSNGVSSSSSKDPVQRKNNNLSKYNSKRSSNSGRFVKKDSQSSSQSHKVSNNSKVHRNSSKIDNDDDDDDDPVAKTGMNYNKNEDKAYDDAYDEDLQRALKLSLSDNKNTSSSSSSSSSKLNLDVGVKSTSLATLRRIAARREYEPCSHAGPCNLNNCSCLKGSGFCEKFCACSADCRHSFPGCKCKRGFCRTNVCPCFAANRECDPDLCGHCGVSIHPVFLSTVENHIQINNEKMSDSVTDGKSVVETTPFGFRMCANANIRRNMFKRVFIGRSTIHGWGAFIAEKVEKNDFIIEYVGEIITQDEAERRGKIYDKTNSSFLFNLNDEVVVDATRKGNKAKYINHSKNPNCYSKIMMVNGAHKICLFAKKTIEAGEELSFDYSYSEDNAITWSRGTGLTITNNQDSSNQNSSDSTNSITLATVSCKPKNPK